MTSGHFGIYGLTIVGLQFTSGCKQPCVGLLECGAQSTYNSAVIFTQAEETTNIRYQNNAPMTIEGTEALGDNWLLHANNQEFVVSTSNGQAFQIPFSVGTISLSTPLWDSDMQNDGLWPLEDWWVSIHRKGSSPSQPSTGYILLEHPDESPITIYGTESFSQWPYRVFGCGDLDGDNHDDWIAVHLDNQGTGEVRLGLSHLWLDFVGDQDKTSLPVLNGTLEAEGFGHAVVCDKDWTGDEQIDLIVSSPFANVNGVTAAGRAQLFVNDNGTFYKSASISGTRKHEWLGYRLTAGDIEGDGRLELASTTFEDSNAAVQLWTWQGAPSNIWRERYTIRSPKSETFFGYDILLANIDGDDKDDLLIGEPYYDGAKTEAGLLTIYKGTTNLLDWNTNFDLIFGTEAYAHLGYNIQVHDVNDDNIQDIILPVIEVE